MHRVVVPARQPMQLAYSVPDSVPVIDSSPHSGTYAFYSGDNTRPPSHSSRVSITSSTFFRVIRDPEGNEGERGPGLHMTLRKCNPISQDNIYYQHTRIELSLISWGGQATFDLGNTTIKYQERSLFTMKVLLSFIFGLYHSHHVRQALELLPQYLIANT